jgi:hypothetical protein
MQQENLSDIRHKISIIYKHIQLMHNELRYQAKTYTISKKLSKEKKKKIPHLLPTYLFFIFNQQTEKQQRHAYGKGNDI